MHKTLSPWAVAVGLAWVGLGTPASAAVVTYTYTGTVDLGWDQSGVFGTDTDLLGKTFRLIETFDTSRPIFAYSDSHQSYQFGGTAFSAPNAASLTITIGTGTRSVTDMSDMVSNSSDTGQHLDFVKNTNATGYEYSGFSIQSALMPASYAQNYTLNASNALFMGTYQWFDADHNVYASLKASTLDVTAGTPSPVPLPGGLPLFGAALLGLGTAGYHFRRRKTNSLV